MDIETWRQGKHGKLLRFLDAQTLREVRHMWSMFSILNGSSADKSPFVKSFKETLARSKAISLATHGDIQNWTATRSSVPLGIKALDDIDIYHRHFWSEPPASDPRQLPNPTFMPRDGSTSLLHYGLDSLLGFHMSLAYASLDKGSPLIAQTKANTRAEVLIATARTQSEAWAKAFLSRAECGLATVRLFAGDAIAFSHALRAYNDGTPSSRLLASIRSKRMGA